MISVLSAFIALVVLAWGFDVAALDRGAVSLPWRVYEQGLYLSGLLAIGMMSLTMVVSMRPALLVRRLGGAGPLFRLHRWAGTLAAVFAALHWLIEMADDLVEAVFGEAGEPGEPAFGGFYEMLREAGEEIGEFVIYLLLAMVVLSLWKRFPRKIWRPLHRAMPLLYLLLAFHAAVLAPPTYWTQPVGLLLATLLASGSVAAAISINGWIGRDRHASPSRLAPHA